MALTLDGVRAERTAKEVSRNLRNEQDSAYERSLAIDRERARQRKRGSRSRRKPPSPWSGKKAQKAALLESKRNQWKTWRAARLLPEPAAGDKNVGSGAGRIVRRFPQDAPVEELYAFVECYDRLRAREDGADDDDYADDSAVEAPEAYEHKYLFRIASTLAEGGV
ncbi:Ubx domain-containing protein [Metarhizium acridum]|nr:Ubx domain-containing protein [Metarhizium acridum]